MADPEQTPKTKASSILDGPNKRDEQYQEIQRELKAQLDANAEIQQATQVYGDEKIPEYWQHKQTGEIVRVTKYMYLVGGGRRVVFTNPAWGFETSATRDEFTAEYRVYQTTRS